MDDGSPATSSQHLEAYEISCSEIHCVFYDFTGYKGILVGHQKSSAIEEGSQSNEDHLRHSKVFTCSTAFKIKMNEYFTFSGPLNNE